MPAAVRALDGLGLLARVRRQALPIEGIAFAVDGGTAARARFCDAAGEPAYGLGIKRRVLDTLLLDAARSEPGVTVLEGVAATGLLRAGDHTTGLETTAGAIAARAVIAADGLRSPLRARLGLDQPVRSASRIGLRVHLRVPTLPFQRRVFVLVAPRLEYYVTPVGVSEIQVAVLGTRAAFWRRGSAHRRWWRTYSRTRSSGRTSPARSRSIVRSARVRSASARDRSSPTGRCCAAMPPATSTPSPARASASRSKPGRPPRA